ncbi:MAG: twin transmembrane helix small protein [Rhodospirillaceae bacterium]|nr:twin transmembrane helix small protein [Rhodospirillaceae bacterium]
MKTALIVLVAVAMIGVVAVLLAGVVLMGRGGEANARWSNKLMRARVGLQLAAVLLLMLLFLAYRS